MTPIHGVFRIPKKLKSTVFCRKLCSRGHFFVAASPTLKFGIQVHKVFLRRVAELGGI